MPRSEQAPLMDMNRLKRPKLVPNLFLPRLGDSLYINLNQKGSENTLSSYKGLMPLFSLWLLYKKIRFALDQEPEASSRPYIKLHLSLSSEESINCTSVLNLFSVS